jgi:hypothetical protein
VLSHQAWMRLFAGDPGVLGRELDLDGRKFSIVGVLHQAFTASTTTRRICGFRCAPTPSSSGPTSSGRTSRGASKSPCASVRM